MGRRCASGEARIVVWTTLRNLPYRVIHSGMTSLVLSITGLVLLAALLVLLVWAVRVVSATIANPSPSTSLADDLGRTMLQQVAILKRLDEITAAVAHGIEHVDRNEKRVRGIVKGAERRFEAAGFQDPGTKAEVASLPRVDEPSGAEEGLQPVPDGVESDSWGSVPGMRRG